MRLPMLKVLKKREYRELALFQDTVVSVLYHVDSAVVLHGGTCIWRCFGGSRFSSDIDAYIPSRSSLEKIKTGILAAASDHDVRVDKIKDTGNLIFMAFSSGTAYLKVEMNYMKRDLRPVPTRFEKADGTYTEVLAPGPEDLILEKMAAYSDRRFIRDIYDMYVLSDYVEPSDKTKKAVIGFIDAVRPPVNEDDLKALVYEGPVPSFKGMIEHIRGRFS
jgi:predicted nucleotidyltransferase component of viral defense system